MVGFIDDHREEHGVEPIWRGFADRPVDLLRPEGLRGRAVEALCSCPSGCGAAGGDRRVCARGSARAAEEPRTPSPSGNRRPDRRICGDRGSTSCDPPLWKGSSRPLRRPEWNAASSLDGTPVPSALRFPCGGMPLPRNPVLKSGVSERASRPLSHGTSLATLQFGPDVRGRPRRPAPQRTGRKASRAAGAGRPAAFGLVGGKAIRICGSLRAVGRDASHPAGRGEGGGPAWQRPVAAQVP
jgi:hypothetical protein